MMRRLLLIAALAILAACGDTAEDTATTTTGPEVPPTTAPATADPDVTTTAAEPTTPTTEPEDDTVRVVVVIDAGTVTVSVDGAPLDGRVMVPIGATVSIEMTTDVREELHVHGYDILIEAEAGATASEEFIADIPGIFEVERHFAGHVRIFDLRVE